MLQATKQKAAEQTPRRSFSENRCSVWYAYACLHVRLTKARMSPLQSSLCSQAFHPWMNYWIISRGPVVWRARKPQSYVWRHCLEHLFQCQKAQSQLIKLKTKISVTSQQLQIVSLCMTDATIQASLWLSCREISTSRAVWASVNFALPPQEFAHLNLMHMILFGMWSKQRQQQKSTELLEMRRTDTSELVLCVASAHL